MGQHSYFAYFESKRVELDLVHTWIVARGISVNTRPLVGLVQKWVITPISVDYRFAPLAAKRLRGWSRQQDVSVKRQDKTSTN